MTPASYWKQVREACAAKSKGAWWLSEHDGSIQSDDGHVSDNDMSDGDEAFVVIASEALPLALARIEELETARHAIGELLADNGCDCGCDHDYESHDEDCDRCLPCRISAALGKP